MAHFARLDNNNVVTDILVVDNDRLFDIKNPTSGKESEIQGILYLQRVLKDKNSKWKQCSYSGSFRKNYPGVGFIYDEGKDAFIPPQPYPSWTLNEETCRWEPPTPRPSEELLESGKAPYHEWDEETLSWRKVEWSESDNKWVYVE